MQFKTFDVTDKIINQYLFYKNLQININRGKKESKKLIIIFGGLENKKIENLFL